MLGDFALLLTPSLLVKRASIQLHLRNLHWMYWTPGKLVPVSPIFIALAALAAACSHSRAGVQAQCGTAMRTQCATMPTFHL